MKFSILIISFLLGISNLTFGQNNATLFLQGNKLIGDCENKFYTGFEIELDTFYIRIDSTSLFNQFPRIGHINFKNRINIPTEFTITNRAGFPQIMFRFRSNYLTFDNLEFHNDSIVFTVDNDPIVPASESDLKIIRLAKDLLSEEKYWNKQDDRDCSNDLSNKSYSIFCAIRIASLEIEGKYNHRNASLQKLRMIINEKYPDRKWEHRLMDFNNMKETTYKDIIKILEDIETAFLKELETKI